MFSIDSNFYFTNFLKFYFLWQGLFLVILALHYVTHTHMHICSREDCVIIWRKISKQRQKKKFGDVNSIDVHTSMLKKYILSLTI